jgi:hypothetical protein
MVSSHNDQNEKFSSTYTEACFFDIEGHFGQMAHIVIGEANGRSLYLKSGDDDENI